MKKTIVSTNRPMLWIGALVMGAVLGVLGLQDLLFLLIRGLIWTLPLGIVAFSAQLSAQVSAGVVADSIGKYVLVVLGGNVIQFFVILPLFLLAMVRLLRLRHDRPRSFSTTYHFASKMRIIIAK